MFWWKAGAIVLILIVLLLIFLYFLKVRLSINLSVKGKDIELKVEVVILRFRVFKATLPVIDMEEDPLELILKGSNNVSGKEEVELSSNEWGSLWHKMNDFLGVLKDQKRLAEVFQIPSLSWETAIGCDQADWTAMVTGFLWAFKSNLIGLLYNVLQMKEPFFQVNPRFNQWFFETHFSCMISFRLGKAIGQVFRIRRQYKRRRSHRGRASYTRVNEDSS